MASREQFGLDFFANHFNWLGECHSASRMNVGHIHDTFLCTWLKNGEKFRVIHQRLNHKVFPNIQGLVTNWQKACECLSLSQERTANGRLLEVPYLLDPVTGDGNFSPSLDQNGNYWRSVYFIEEAQSFESCPNEAWAYEAGWAFGRFQHALRGLSHHAVIDTIPYFHFAPHRYSALKDSVRKDIVGRVKGAKDEINYALTSEQVGTCLSNSLNSGELPLRVVHNDTKFNNLLFDPKTGKAKAVIDLDTTMAGSSLFDFGDLVRNAAVTGKEDERDLSQIEVVEEKFKAITVGFLDEMGYLLSKREIELMALSPQVFALVLGVRFLTDHLSGDTYFKVYEEGHNLYRARAQFRIAQILAKREKELQRIVLAAAVIK